MHITAVRYFLWCSLHATAQFCVFEFFCFISTKGDPMRLRICHLFNDIADVALASLETRIRWKNLLPDEVICHKGDVSVGLYILVRGQLLVYDLLHNGQEVSLSVLSPGAFFGELSVIDLSPRTASIRATQASLVGLLPQSIAQELFYTHPRVAQRVMEHLAGKVRELTVQRVLLSLPQAFQRVCAWLVLSQVSAPGGGLWVQDAPKQLDLANMLNTSRETVSRSMARLLRDGVLEKVPGGLRVVQPQVLARLAQEESAPLLGPTRHQRV
jgi:CRP-like cAMP-binding protein